MSVCLTPYMTNHATIENHKVPVPCGKCPPCLARRTSQWAFRLRQEGRVNLLSHFVTLSYANSPKSKNGLDTLKKKDLQDYFKRLRKKNEILDKKIAKSNNVIYEKIKITYYVAGEYGSTRKRPHYHIIIFNAHESAIRSAWSINGVSLGYVHVGTVSNESIGYSLKYISKKIINKNKFWGKDDRQKEFQLCSKGIGISYLSQAKIQWHTALPRERCLVVDTDGMQLSLPRYYRLKIFNDEQKQLIADHMQSLAIEKEFELFKIHGERLDAYIHQQTQDRISRLRKRLQKDVQIF